MFKYNFKLNIGSYNQLFTIRFFNDRKQKMTRIAMRARPPRPAPLPAFAAGLRKELAPNDYLQFDFLTIENKR